MDRPTFPVDLSTLSNEALQALIDAAVAWAQAHNTDESDENFAAMREVLADYDRAATEMAGRSAEPPVPSPTLAELTARFVPVAPPAVAAVVPATDPLAPGGIEAAPGAGGFSTEQLTAAVTAGVSAALAAQQATQRAAIEASAEEIALPDVGRLQPGAVRLHQRPAGPAPIRPTETIIASAEIPGYAAGQPLSGFDQIGRAMISKREAIGHVPEMSAGEKITVAQVNANWPEDRMLRFGSEAANQAKIEALTSPEAITAAGGECVPAMPYYGLMVQAGAHRPTRDTAGLVQFGMDRMGVTVLAPPNISSPGTSSRVVTDGATNTNTTVTSASAAFDRRDRGAAISGTGIPAGAYIVTVTNSTTVTISAAATATATGVTITIVRKGAVGVITAAVDAAALNGTDAQIIAGTKPCLHVDCPAPTTYKPDAFTWCLEFGNWTTKAFPEQMPAWLRLTLAVWARTAETGLLDKMSALSTQITATGIVGALRSLVTQQIKAAAYFRNRNRLTDDVVLRCHMPRWVLDLGAVDLILGSGYEAEFLTMARASVTAALAEANVRPSFYSDSGTTKGQLFAPGGVQGAKHGAAALVAFPSTVCWYMYPEGSFAFGDGGSLDFGLWRDSSLNELNNYRMMAETWETIIPLGYEMLEVTSTVVANGTFAGAAYGSNTVSSPVAIPTSF